MSIESTAGAGWSGDPGGLHVPASSRYDDHSARRLWLADVLYASPLQFDDC